MVGGVFQGDNNPLFPNPVTLCNVITVPPTGGVVTAQFITNRSAFRCVRFLAPASNPSCNVAELKFFAPDPPPAPVTIIPAWDGTHFTLSWGNGGTLLEAVTVNGPWTTNTGATSPFTVAPTEPSKFYRIIQ